MSAPLKTLLDNGIILFDLTTAFSLVTKYHNCLTLYRSHLTWPSSTCLIIFLGPPTQGTSLLLNSTLGRALPIAAITSFHECISMKPTSETDHWWSNLTQRRRRSYTTTKSEWYVCGICRDRAENEDPKQSSFVGVQIQGEYGKFSIIYYTVSIYNVMIYLD